MGIALEDIKPDDLSKLTATDRAAFMTIWLGSGKSFTLEEAAEALGCSSVNGAYKLFSDLSRLMPICADKGRWQCLPEYVEDCRRARAAARRREERQAEATRKAWFKVFDREAERV